MSFLSRAARSGTTSALPDAGAGCHDADQPGRYLTDGVNLYRHLGAISSGMGQMVGLENCRTLDGCPGFSALVASRPAPTVVGARLRLVRWTQRG